MRVVREYSAPEQVQKKKSPFTVMEVEGDFLREVTTFDKATGTLVKHEVHEDRQFLVQFARGHSIVFYSEEELNEAGFGENARLPSSSANMVSSEMETKE